MKNGFVLLLQRTRAAHCVVVGVALAAASLCSPAQQWPAKPVKLLTATATGGTLDITARSFADQMSRATGQSWLVENHAGGLGVTGTDMAAKSPPDGYMFFVGSTENLVLAPLQIRELPYDPVKDFAPVAVLIDTTVFAIASYAGLPAKNLRELLALAKSRPGKLSYAVTGSTAEMVGNWLKKQTSMDFIQVPYKAATQSAQDVATGRVDFTINALPPLSPFIKGGKLRVLAMTSASRLPGWEAVETVNETVPGFSLAGFLVLAVPARTPIEIQQRANREAVAIVKSPQFLDRSAAYGWFNRQPARTLQETGEFIRTERERWTRVMDGLGIKPH